MGGGEVFENQTEAPDRLINGARREVVLEQGLPVGDHAVMSVRVSNIDAKEHGGEAAGRSRRSKGNRSGGIRQAFA
jgi:hypothetical protein